MSTLAVLARSESFSALWPELAALARAESRVVTAAGETGPAAELVALVLAVAGVEEEAEGALRELAAAGAPAPLVVGARADHRLAAALVRAGAADYFALPGDVDALRAEIRDRAARRDARAAAGRLEEAERRAFDFGRIIGRSPPLRAALDRAARIIPRGQATVLVTGETGTGKELIAQAIHRNGPRASGPFIELNCNAIPPTLLESELFGHEKGAFTDARTAKPGLFEAADRGTLFLDEIGDLPLVLQGKILKALEEKQVRRVGAVRGREVDVRIIAATHVDLAAAVRRGGFREDLFYRLSVIPIHLPPLRDRGDDVLLLAEHFLRTLAAQYGMTAPALSPTLRRALMAHSWPGNVRELRNGLERALLLADGPLRPEDLFHGGDPSSASGGHRGGSGELPFPATLDQIERAAAEAMLARVEGNKSAAADALGISRSRLYRLLTGDAEGVAE
ncbi:sigma 54-interacting transcriptional regulator [Longimicrobium terrae]|uniref:DNA-binding NtrC family response regulator n=1 Tax=Longimicrobium terrae TaxID=1639882 RepID=A0A841GZI2_9BACT|nr:DNA-binding NtrC family response regulator [Longimicrobium terrae]MBB6071157.1 DNA-binding NtrC family response regulator [Longimicrobium terrae]NNC29206.1 sigma 54-interacting transcriptional regulator [Longimicrobium terrae]